jgi:hypothetical protein
MSPEDASANSNTGRDGTIDNVAPANVDLIKMDIEGAERPALAGAERVLREQRPHLAIAAYHKPEDITEIFHIFKQYGYRNVRFAHYSESNDDSIFVSFGIRKERRLRDSGLIEG